MHVCGVGGRGIAEVWGGGVSSGTGPPVRGCSTFPPLRPALRHHMSLFTSRPWLEPKALMSPGGTGGRAFRLNKIRTERDMEAKSGCVMNKRETEIWRGKD